MIQSGIGTSATTYFSAASDPPDEHAPRSDKTVSDAKTELRVLIVEDEGLVAMNMESALTEDGFRVVGVHDNAADAIDAARRLQPDVILMDITLRDGDGIAAARAVLQQRDVRIIFVSGNSDPQTLAAAQALHPAGFIMKPFISASFARLVRARLRTQN